MTTKAYLLDVEGIPVRTENLEAYAWDVDPPRRFPYDSAIRNGGPINPRAFERLVTQFRDAADPERAVRRVRSAWRIAIVAFVAGAVVLALLWAWQKSVRGWAGELLGTAFYVAALFLFLTIGPLKVWIERWLRRRADRPLM